MKWIEKRIAYVIGVIIVLSIIAPVVLSHSAFFKIFDLSKSGNIGDAIGGITAPFLGLVTIVLIYLTYKSQKTELEETRKIATEQSKTMTLQRFENTFFKLLDNHAELIKNYEITGSASATLHTWMRQLKTYTQFYNYALTTKNIAGFVMFNYNPTTNPFTSPELSEKVINYINQIGDYIYLRNLDDDEKHFYFTILFNSLLDSEKYLYGYQSSVRIVDYINERSEEINYNYNAY